MSLELYAKGLPRTLAEACTDIDQPDTFDQWSKAAQKHHRSWLRKKALRDNCRATQPKDNQPRQNKGWCWKRTKNVQRPRENPHQGQGRFQSPRPRLPPRDEKPWTRVWRFEKISNEKERLLRMWETMTRTRLPQQRSSESHSPNRGRHSHERRRKLSAQRSWPHPP